jgi:hypothetical protein
MHVISLYLVLHACAATFDVMCVKKNRDNKTGPYVLQPHRPENSVTLTTVMTLTHASRNTPTVRMKENFLYRTQYRRL